jgi:hypothetical protein
MSESSLSFGSSEIFRKSLITRNLPPYRVLGVFSPPSNDQNYEYKPSDFNVKDSDDKIINRNTVANNLYPLNAYGPEGGYGSGINFNGPPLPVLSNSGPYEPVETKLDLVNEFYIDVAYTQNIFGPPGGYQDMYDVTDVQNNNKIYQPYWEPSSFLNKTYTAYEIILMDFNTDKPKGDITNDSYLAILSAKDLQRTLKLRAALETQTDINLRINVDGYTQPDASNTALRANAPLSSRDYQITLSDENDSFLARLSGEYDPSSPIPGDYFLDDLKTRYATSIGQIVNIFAGRSTLVGEILGPGLSRYVNPSQVFLQYTTDGQKSALFGNLAYNRYRPAYQNSIIGGLLGNLLITGINNLIEGTGTQLPGDYYVGSVVSDPSYIVSPVTQVPINEFGRETGAPVLGPQALAITYEGNENKINFGPQAKSYSDGGGIDGTFVWVSPKYKDDAGFKVGPGGKKGSQDEDFNIISNSYKSNESLNVTFQPGSILDETQRLIDAADRARGEARLKHVGNAINQVSKVFNDGYREMTKGSQVISYVDNATGTEVGREYCRVFAKDTPYLTFNDLQKSQGITNANRRFTYSILDSTYNLNISPYKGSESTNIVDGKVKKYMFSIENLAWKSGNKPGFTYDSLPICERGPNGGRIMWFPPYDIKFSETSTPTFNPTSFLGRPEPIYTYKETRRTGSLSWKIIVDHPSILNVIVNKVMNGTTAAKANSMIDSFFAGCLKYDIYDLAIKYNTVPIDQLKAYQDIISDPRLTSEEIAQDVVNTIPKDNTPGNQNLATNTDTTQFSTFVNSALYFDINSGSQLVDLNLPNWDVGGVDKFIEAKAQPDYNKITNDLFTQLKTLLDGNKDATVNIEIEGLVAKRDQFQANKISEERANTFKSLIVNSVGQNANRIMFTTVGLGDQGSVSAPTFNTINCSELSAPDSQQNPQTFACCTAYIKSISANVPPQQGQQNQQTNPNDQTAQNPSLQSQPIKPQPGVDINEKIKKNIGKKVLRHLLSECDYFEVMKQSNPMYFDSIKEKVKFFSPTFHSTTPEGLNARLTFLNQCVRPGDTIPTIGADGKPRFNDASNTVFGTPPILILRIGDFYNTKIVPSSLQISYEPLIFDMNPEGIGMQPMIANVTLGFDFIGGSGLARPIEKLQNALSFNYFANTEIYDERADATEDTSAIDKKIFDALIPPVTKSDVNKPIENKGGATIGEVTSSTTQSGVTSGTITYRKIFDEFLDGTQNYFTNVTNYASGLINDYNYGVLLASQTDRQYVNCSPNTSSCNGGKIYGKSDNWENNMNDIFNEIQSSISALNDPIQVNVCPTGQNLYADKDLRQLRRNYEKYVKNYKTTLISEINQKIQELVGNEVTYVQFYRKLNFVENGTSSPTGYDGYVNEKGDPVIYDISANTLSSPSVYPDTLAELRGDYLKVASATTSFYSLLITKKLIYDQSPFTSGLATNFEYSYPQGYDRVVQNSYQGYYIGMSKVYLDSSLLEVFKKELVDGISDQRLITAINNQIENLKTNFTNQQNIDKKLINDFLNGSDYVLYKPFNTITKGKTREFTFVSNNGAPNSIKKDLKNIYKDVNENNDKDTFIGKIKFK